MFWKEQRKTLHANYAQALHIPATITVISTDEPLLLMHFQNAFCFYHTYMSYPMGQKGTLNSWEGTDPNHQNNSEKDSREAPWN